MLHLQENWPRGQQLNTGMAPNPDSCTDWKIIQCTFCTKKNQQNTYINLAKKLKSFEIWGQNLGLFSVLEIKRTMNLKWRGQDYTIRYKNGHKFQPWILCCFYYAMLSFQLFFYILVFKLFICFDHPCCSLDFPFCGTCFAKW